MTGSFPGSKRKKIDVCVIASSVFGWENPPAKDKFSSQFHLKLKIKLWVSYTNTWNV